ncbi:hypothetical protein COCOBI_18-1100 [Coccomyxa sp. Obi]|nr:hypothetical protein COCOBI_18-1100 [Coccomyxa sp. Obi]
MFRAAVASIPWPDFKPTELEVDIWRLERHLEDLTKELAAIEDETRLEFDPEHDNWKNILGVVAKEDEVCRGVEYLNAKMRTLSLEAMPGYYLHKENERLTKNL